MLRLVLMDHPADARIGSRRVIVTMNYLKLQYDDERNMISHV